MVEMVHDRIAAGETTVVPTAAVLYVESKWKNYHITTFPGQSLSKTGLSLEEAMDLSRDRQIEDRSKSRENSKRAQLHGVSYKGICLK
jgi:hypothetical protein